MSVSTTVKTIQDIMRKDAGVDGDAQRINQLVWMFFLKIFDDRESEKEILEDDYRSPIPKELRWRNWAANPEGITGEALADFINNHLFKTLKGLTSPDPRAQLVRHVFEEANNYMKSGTLMRQVINKINEVDFNRKNDLHLFGDIYEQILRDLQSAGNAGEFYTPRAVTQFMVEMVDPQLGERVLDPACGTGGFLTNTIEHVRRKYVHSVEDEQILQSSIKGVEKKQLPYFLCVTNLMLHGIDTPNQVLHDNTLARPYRDYQPEDRVDVIVTNPPFGGMEEDGIEKNFPKTYSTRETADLFLVLIIHLLREGGRGAIVLPDGTLFGEGIKTRIKEKLLTECNLHTIVRLPNGVFNPYTGIKTNLLFFTKGQQTKEVWYYEHPYPPGVKSYNKTKPIRGVEFEPEKTWWANRVENDRAWCVSFEEIAENNFNLDSKNPHAIDDDHGDLEELLATHKKIMDSLAETRDRLKFELTGALTRYRSEIELVDLQIFFNNFVQLTDAPTNVTQLRDLVLQLAVGGKLNTQNPADEPATALLQKLSRENGKDFSPLAEVPFALPGNWVWVRFGDVFDIQGGTQPPKSEFISVPADGYIRLLQIRDFGVKAEPVYVRRDSIRNLCTAEDVMLARYGASVGKIFMGQDGAYNVALTKVIFDHQHIFNRFVFFLLKSSLFQDTLRLMSRSAQAGFNKGDIHPIPLPLPPLEEQKRIVAKVNQLMALCDELEAKLRQAEADSEKLMNAAIQHVLDAVRDPSKAAKEVSA